MVWDISLLVFTIACCVAVIVLIARSKAPCQDFDERQKQARGTAFTAAYWTVMGYLVVSAVAETALERPWCTAQTNIGLAMGLSLGVFVIWSVFTDAFIQPRQNAPRRMLIWLLLAAAQLILGMRDVLEEGSLTADGRLDLPLSLPVGVILLLAAALSWARSRAAREEAE